MLMGMTRLAAVPLAVLLSVVAGHTQVCDLRTGAPMQMKVQLTFDEQASDFAPGAVATQNDPLHRGDSAENEHRYDFNAMQIHIQLQDPVGGTFQEQTPNSDGLVRMTVCRKSIYRLRVVGPQIEEAIVDSVQPGSGDSLVTVVLHRKLTKEEEELAREQRKAQRTMISAHSLNIPGKARKQVEKGDSALKRGELADAEKAYSKAIAFHPEYEEAENKLGVVYMREGKRSEGQTAFTRSLEMNHDYAPARINLAKIAFDEKRYDDAYSFVTHALRSEPLNPDALFVAAEAAFFKGAYAETVSYTQTLHTLPHAKYALAHFLAGRSLEEQNQPQAALAQYETFIQEDPSDPNAPHARELIAYLQNYLARGGVSSGLPHERH